MVRTRPLPVAASGEHADVLRLAIVAWKEESRTALLRPLAHLLATSVAEVMDDSASALLVPVPTSRRSRMARGADVVDQLAHGAAGLLCAAGADVVVRQALRVARRTADQSGLGARERARNLHGAFEAREPLFCGREIVVVDDIVTTGATIGEAVRALTVVGHRVRAAATIAHRPHERPRLGGAGFRGEGGGGSGGGG